MSKVIKTQEDLDKVIKKEKGLYYITLSGQVAMFSGQAYFTKITADEKLMALAEATTEEAQDVIRNGSSEELQELLDSVITTYLVPYRTH